MILAECCKMADGTFYYTVTYTFLIGYVKKKTVDASLSSTVSYKFSAELYKVRMDFYLEF